MVDKPSLTLPGTVQKIVRPVVPDQSERAQIAIGGTDHLYKEVRIQNTLTDKDGKIVHLESGANVRYHFFGRSGRSATKR